MVIKYSKNFERDYNWYLEYKNIFTFCGTGIDKSLIITDLINGKSAKECFYLRESQGKKIATKEPELLFSLYLVKSSINFHIKMWAEGFSDYGYSTVDKFLNTKELVWNADGTFKEESLMETYNLLPWMIEALKKQVNKIQIL